MKFYIFILLSFSFYTLLSGIFPRSYKGITRALSARNPVKISSNEMIISSISAKIQPYITLDKAKEYKMSAQLKTLFINQSPNEFQSRAMTKGFLYAIPTLILTPISIFFLPISIFVLYQVIQSETATLSKRVDERKRLIEHELPQFAGTIRQSLSSTRDIFTIFESYRKVANDNLRGEIEITLNDMRTGNVEDALKALEGRIASGKFSELVRGIIGITRGDDMKVYFDMLTLEYQKAENEAVKKELLLRPKKLGKYIAVLFACVFALTMLTIIMMILSQTSMFF